MEIETKLVDERIASLRIDRNVAARMEAAMVNAMQACTSNVPQPDIGAFTLDKLREAMDLTQLLSPPPPPRLGAITESWAMTERIEDWSKVRSPSRTRRRMRYNADRVYRLAPRKDVLRMPDGSLVMHPVTAQQFRRMAIHK